MILGDNWIGDVANAIMTSPELGLHHAVHHLGRLRYFYDHMAPPSDVPTT